MAYAPASGNTKVREYGLEYYALSSFEFEPEILGQWYKKYGKGFDLNDFVTIAGNTVNIARDTVTAFEDGALVRPIQINASGIATSTTAGDDITFRLNANEYDSDNNTYLRVGDSIIIPAAYMSGNVPAMYRVTAVGATSSADCTASPLKSTSQITTLVPANAYLKVGPTSYGRGMGQPSARSTYGYQRSFYTHILKESVEVTGGMIAQQSYRQKLKNGGEGLWLRAQAEAERLFDEQKGDVIFLSDYNDNSVTGTDSHSASVSIKTTKGLWNHMEDLAQKLNYTTSFALTDFDSIKVLFQSQGVTDTEVAFLVGPTLNTNLDNMGLSYLTSYSNGSDLIDGMQKLGVTFRAFEKNGMTYVNKELVSFSNPNTYGVDNLGTYFGAAGMMIPMSQVTVVDKNNEFGKGIGAKVSIPNVSVGYLNNGGEDRTNIFKVVSGVNGAGFPAVNQYDKIEAYYLSEFALIAMQVNQMVVVRKVGTY